ncbi:hypothetical protein [Bradyrhizobium sp. ORS 111]|uniref:hypothetical protein n=1 Tax=Bradyrhizobium sp. ORS 111 TaxID=1685958 RepID=UPI003890959B
MFLKSIRYAWSIRRELFSYAWQGSWNLAAGLSAFFGVVILWLVLLLTGRSDVVLPTTLPGQIEFFAVTTVLLWIVIFLARLLLAPMVLLIADRAELRALRLRLRPALELIFDHNDAEYVRPIPSLYSARGEFFWIGVRNAGGQTLDDVTIRALDSWFTQEAIATAMGRRQRSNSPVEVSRWPALHPGAREIVQVFGLGYDSASSNPDYIFNTMQRFTLEVTARDTPTVRRVFLYDPKARPMFRMLSETESDQPTRSGALQSP